MVDPARLPSRCFRNTMRVHHHSDSNTGNGDPLVTAEQIERVKAGVGTLTREQVVAEFGEPQESYAND
jgi:hypothetical protein